MCEKLEAEARDERDEAVSEAWQLCERLEAATGPMKPLCCQWRIKDPWPRIDACVTRMLGLYTSTTADQTHLPAVPSPKAKPRPAGATARVPAAAVTAIACKVCGCREAVDADEASMRSAAAARLFGRSPLNGVTSSQGVAVPNDGDHGQQLATVLDPICSAPRLATAAECCGSLASHVNDPSAAKPVPPWPSSSRTERSLLSRWGQESGRRAARVWESFRPPAPTASRSPTVYEAVPSAIIVEGESAAFDELSIKTMPEVNDATRQIEEAEFEEARFTLLLSSTTTDALQ